MHFLTFWKPETPNLIKYQQSNMLKQNEPVRTKPSAVFYFKNLFKKDTSKKLCNVLTQQYDIKEARNLYFLQAAIQINLVFLF